MKYPRKCPSCNLVIDYGEDYFHLRKDHEEDEAVTPAAAPSKTLPLAGQAGGESDE
jgi:hypothetical protein